MHHTLVAVFDKHADAQQAHDELLASGFSRSALRLSGATPDGDAGSGITHFFSNLFGSDDERTGRYQGAVTRGQHVLTLRADSLPEVERGADVIERFGPVDIVEHAEGAATMGAGAMLSSGSAMGAAPMAAQSVQLAQSEQSAPSTAMQAGATQSGLRDDDSHFRNHFDSTYSASGAAWDDYAPAYGYGSQVASSGRYTGRQWDEIEPELRSDWESRNTGGPSTWEKMKAAVRHGWDRITTGDSGLTY